MFFVQLLDCGDGFWIFGLGLGLMSLERYWVFNFWLLLQLIFPLWFVDLLGLGFCCEGDKGF